MSIFIDYLKLFYDDLCQHPTHLLMIDKAHMWVKSTSLRVIGNKGYCKGLSMSLVLLIMFLLIFSMLMAFLLSLLLMSLMLVTLLMMLLLVMPLLVMPLLVMMIVMKMY